MKETRREPGKQNQHSKTPVKIKKKRNIINISIAILGAALILIVGTQLVLNMPSKPASSSSSSDSSLTKNMKKNEYGGYGSYKFIPNPSGNGGQVEFIDVPDIKYDYFGNLDNTFSTMFLQDINAYRQNKGLNTLSRVSNVSHGKTVNFEYPDINKIAVLYGADTEDKLAEVVLRKFLETPANVTLLNSPGSNIYLNTMINNNNMTIVVKIAYEDTSLPAPIDNNQNNNQNNTYREPPTRSNSYASTNERQSSNYSSSSNNEPSRRERQSTVTSREDSSNSNETPTSHSTYRSHESTTHDESRDSHERATRDASSNHNEQDSRNNQDTNNR